MGGLHGTHLVRVLGVFQRSKVMFSRGSSKGPHVVRRCGQNQHAVASNGSDMGDALSGRLLKSI